MVIVVRGEMQTLYKSFDAILSYIYIKYLLSSCILCRNISLYILKLNSVMLNTIMNQSSHLKKHAYSA